MGFRFYGDGTVDRRTSIWRRSLVRSQVLDVTFEHGRFRKSHLPRGAADAVVSGRAPLSGLYAGDITVSVVTNDWVETIKCEDDVAELEGSTCWRARRSRAGHRVRAAIWRHAP